MPDAAARAEKPHTGGFICTDAVIDQAVVRDRVRAGADIAIDAHTAVIRDQVCRNVVPGRRVNTDAIREIGPERIAADLVPGDGPPVGAVQDADARCVCESDEVSANRAVHAAVDPDSVPVCPHAGAGVDECTRGRPDDVAFDQDPGECLRTGADLDVGEAIVERAVAEPVDRDASHGRVIRANVDAGGQIIAILNLHLRAVQLRECRLVSGPGDAVRAGTDAAAGPENTGVGVADVCRLGRAINGRASVGDRGQGAHGTDHGNAACQLICQPRAQPWVRQAVRYHEQRSLAAGGLSRLGEPDIAEPVRIDDELPQRTVARVVGVDDRVEVVAEVDAGDAGRRYGCVGNRLRGAGDAGGEYSGRGVHDDAGSAICRVGYRRILPADVVGCRYRTAGGRIGSKGLDRQMRGRCVAWARAANGGIHHADGITAGGQTCEAVVAAATRRRRCNKRAAGIVKFDTCAVTARAARCRGCGPITARTAAVIDILEDGAGQRSAARDRDEAAELGGIVASVGRGRRQDRARPHAGRNSDGETEPVRGVGALIDSVYRIRVGAGGPIGICTTALRCGEYERLPLAKAAGVRRGDEELDDAAGTCESSDDQISATDRRVLDDREIQQVIAARIRVIAVIDRFEWRRAGLRIVGHRVQVDTDLAARPATALVGDRAVRINRVPGDPVAG